MIRGYFVNEIFFSIQGEGVRQGIPHVFVRFQGCNMRCDIKEGPKSPGGFACDTEFESGNKMTLPEILEQMKEAGGNCHCTVLTGGEPGLQIDKELVAALHEAGYFIAVETNGSIELPRGIDWICVSPKVAEHAIKQLHAHEVKYVRAKGQSIPKPRIKATHQLISPAFEGERLPLENLEWCMKLAKEHPGWRLSIQLHKFLRLR